MFAVRRNPLSIIGGSLSNGPSSACGTGYEGATFNGDERAAATEELLDQLTASYPDARRVMVVAGHYLPTPGNETPKNSYVLLAEALEICSQLRKRGLDSAVLIYINDIHMQPEARREYYRSFALPEALADLAARHPEQRFYVAGQKKVCDRVLREKHRLVGQRKIVRRDLEQGHAYFLDPGDAEPFIITYENSRSGAIRCIQACTKVIHIIEQLGFAAAVQLYPVCGRNAVERGAALAPRLYESKIPVVNIYKTRDCFR